MWSNPWFRNAFRGSRSLALVTPVSCAIVSSLFYFRLDNTTVCEPNERAREATETTPKERWIQRLSGVSVPECSGALVDHKKQELETVEAWKDVSWKDAGGRRGDGYVQLFFKGKHAKDTHWIQFIKRQKWDKEGNPVNNEENVRVAPSLWHRRGEWFLDAPRWARTPFYDSGWGMHNRSETELSIFDQPLGVLDPLVHSNLVIELESYLVIQGQVVWRICWQVVETTENGRQVVFLGGSAGSPREDLEAGTKGWKIGYSHCHKVDETHTLRLENKGYVTK